MKFAPSLLTGVAVAGLLTVGNISFQAVKPSISILPVSAADATGLSAQQKIDLITKNKGVFGSGDQLRRFFFGDLEPVGIQPGGAGHVVNLYNKASNTTFSYCSTFDVVVAVKKGKVEKFAPEEVK
ncbi:hypothetical protein BCD64_13480 [Nostoc sp. MBR 210]|nr:hypothetical protein BCD64_13480 [Nostoc sp. MBR 210]